MDGEFDFWEHVLNSQYAMYWIDENTCITCGWVIGTSH